MKSSPTVLHTSLQNLQTQQGQTCSSGLLMLNYKIKERLTRRTVSACIASHSWGDWILWTNSFTDICGLKHMTDTHEHYYIRVILHQERDRCNWHNMAVPFELLIDSVTEAHYKLPVLLSVRGVGGFVWKRKTQNKVWTSDHDFSTDPHFHWFQQE